MQVNFTTADVNKILTNHLKAIGLVLDNQDVSFVSQMKRKQGGINITAYVNETVPVTTVVETVVEPEVSEPVATTAPVSETPKLFMP